MKIQGSDVLLTSRHIAVKEEAKAESLKVWVGSQRPDFENGTRQVLLPQHDNVDLSLRAKPAMQHNAATSGTRKLDDDQEENPALMFVQMLIELLTGKKIKIAPVAADNGADPQKAAELSQAAQQAQAQVQPGPQPPPQAQTSPVGFGLEYDSTETYAEAEHMDFSAQGMVKTADGHQIAFNLQLSMDRIFVSEKHVGIRLGDAVLQQKDPLMINFNGTAAQLTDTRFSFDIDADGAMDQVSFAGENSGFIALDKNNDGTINDGSELFGTSSGNGFQDLAAYDLDKNGWIDDSDPVFSQLKAWTRDAGGNDSLTGLKIIGVGALYLGTTATQFELKTGSNDSLGTVRSSGVYLNEDGSVGTLQQVDLTV